MIEFEQEDDYENKEFTSVGKKRRLKTLDEGKHTNSCSYFKTNKAKTLSLRKREKK